MADLSPNPKWSFSADWLFRGVLTKLGDAVDSVTGRRWVPSSSLATSELIERLKKLLDAEARQVAGKGMVVPHNISLKMQWDKFSEDSEAGIETLRNELLTAAADHINDSLYYTLAPLALDVKTDYFTEGVKLAVSFDAFDADAQAVEMNVTLPDVKVDELPSTTSQHHAEAGSCLVARYNVNGIKKETKLTVPGDGRISVGRTAENGLEIDDPSVSKLHASIVVGPDSMSVADTGSTNGTFVNGQRLAYGKVTTFGSEDALRFGTVDVAIERIETLKATEEPTADDSTSAVNIGGFEFRSPAPQVIADHEPAADLTGVQPPNDLDQTVSESSSTNESTGERRPDPAEGSE